MDAAWAQVWMTGAVGLIQSGLIGWGLWLMQQASSQRNRQLDQHGQALDQQSQALRDIGHGIQELLRRSESPSQ